MSKFGKRKPFAGGFRIGVISLIAAACGSDAACVSEPCPFSAAAIVFVNSSTSAAPVAGAFLTESAPNSGSQNYCNADDCLVPGGAGNYELDVGAPGFTTVHLSLKVTGTTAVKCGCGMVDTQTIHVALVPIT